MANEAPAKLISIGPKSGTKKDGFNLVTEKVSMINLETNQIEVELLAYDGKTVLLDVGEEAVEDLHKIKLLATAPRFESLKKTANVSSKVFVFVPRIQVSQRPMPPCWI